MALLLVQMTTVLLVALCCGWLARKLGQAAVIGEIIGGILIGPSVFGRVAPQAWAALFPPSSLSGFEILSTVGLILFLFLIGSELDYEHLRQQKRTTAFASIMSIVVPFGMAVLVAHSLRVRLTTPAPAARVRVSTAPRLSRRESRSQLASPQIGRAHV